MTAVNIPMPDLQIVPTSALLAHEEHDSQRSQPLIDRLRRESHIINPPVVAPTGDGRFVILDGANRVFAFNALGYPHMLVQLAPYDSGLVELDTWHHVICGWNWRALVEELRQIPQATLSAHSENGENRVAHIHVRDQESISISVLDNTLEARNSATRKIVSIYQKNAVLQRTTLNDLDTVWDLHPTGIALFVFRRYSPQDILEAAMQGFYLPPGVSRHIVHGRAVRINYPLEHLRNPHIDLEIKNAALLEWVREKVAGRHVRFYAEATFQFDE